MIESADIIHYFITVIFLAIFPGSTAITAVSLSFQISRFNSILFIFGVLTSNLIFIILSAIFRSIGFVIPDYLRLVLPVIGAIGLVLIGIRMIVQVLKITQIEAKTSPLSSETGFSDGFLIHSSNPNTFVFFVSIFLSIVPLDNNYISNVFLLGSIAIITDLIVLFFVSSFSTYFSKAFSSGRSLFTKSPIIAAIFLILLGGRKLCTALQSFL